MFLCRNLKLVLKVAFWWEKYTLKFSFQKWWTVWEQPCTKPKPVWEQDLGLKKAACRFANVTCNDRTTNKKYETGRHDIYLPTGRQAGLSLIFPFPNPTQNIAQLKKKQSATLWQFSSLQSFITKTCVRGGSMLPGSMLPGFVQDCLGAAGFPGFSCPTI